MRNGKATDLINSLQPITNCHNKTQCHQNRRQLLLIVLCAASLFFSVDSALAMDDSEREAESAVKRLIAASRIYDERAMRQASLALAKIGKPAVPALIRAMDDFDDNVRWQAIVALERIGDPHADAAIPKLVHALDDVDPDVRGAAAVALAKLNADDSAVVVAIRTRLNDEHARVRADVNWAMWQLTASKTAISSLVELLAERDWMVTDAAVRHLAAIGKHATAWLLTVVNNHRAAGRAAAVKTLGLIGPQTDEIIPVLVTALGDQDPAVSREAVKAVGRLGPPAVADLLQFLKRCRIIHRVTVVKTMGEIRWDDDSKNQRLDVATALNEILSKSDSSASDGQSKRELLLAAISSLGSLGSVGKIATAKLLDALKNPDPDIRAAAIATLGRVQATSESVKSELRRIAANDAADFVQAAAKDVLNRTPMR